MRETENFCFQNYGTQSRPGEAQTIVTPKLSGDGLKVVSRAPINIGILSPETTKAKVLSRSWGMTGLEIRLASAAAYLGFE